MRPVLIVEDYRCTSSSHQLTEFLKGPIWKDMKAILSLNLQQNRELFDTFSTMEEVREYQGRDAELIHVLNLPELMLDSVKEDEESEAFERRLQNQRRPKND